MIAIISDVHIKSQDDKASRLFLKFLAQIKKKQVSHLYILGDLFDVMVGNHHQYLQEYQHVFSELKSWMNGGKRLTFFEGNHDFHLRELFEKYFEPEIKKDLFCFESGPKVILINDVSCLFCHGDEIEIENPSYHRYRNVIRSKFLKWIINSAGYGLVTSLGKKASGSSRRYSENYDSEYIKEKFRLTAKKAAREFNCKYVFFGHSHVQDNISEGEFNYYNVGFFPKSKTFYLFNEGSVETHKLI